MQVYRVVGGALLNRKNSTTSWLINIIQVYPPHPVNITKGVYREEGMQLTMTVRTHQTLYQRPDMLKIESSIQT